MRMTIKNKLIAGFGILLLMFVVFGIVILNSMEDVQEQFSFVVEHDAPVIANANRLLKLVVDMETGQRGFCITQKEEFLEPYNSANDKFYKLLKTEKELVRDNSSQTKVLERIRDLLDQWHEHAAVPEISKAKEVAAAKNMNERNKAHDELAVLLETGTGKRLIDKIRVEFAEFINVEEQLTEQRYATASQTTLNTRKITLFMVVFSVIFGSTVTALSIRTIISSIGKLLKGTKIIGAGNLKHRIEIKSKDEIGELAVSFNQMVDSREQTENDLHAAKETAISMRDDAEAARKEAEKVNELLIVATAHANDMASQAELTTQFKSQFLANMSHEIRTPMNAIIGFSDILANEEMSSDQKDSVNMIRESGHNLLRLINDILDFSKIEAGQLNTEIIECSLEKILNSVESMMKPLVEKKSLEFKIVEKHCLPSQIRSDPVRLHQCLVNLLNNAVKFTEHGYVHIYVSLEEKERQAYIRFDIEDTGIGIAEDRQDLIFESFTQADGSTTRKYGGTGLGLAITKQLAELLGGELVLISEVGTGSTFSLIIPAGVDVTKQPLLDRHNIAEMVEDEKGKSDHVQFSGRCLIAEDVAANQMVIKRILENVGVEVSIANDGLEAVAKAQGGSFDLIFMDMQMPNMNGYEATKKLREEGIATAVVALTANAMKGDDEECFAAGCDGYLAKPIDRSKLFKVLAKYLSPTPEDGGCSVAEAIDSIKNEVDELNDTIRANELSGGSGILDLQDFVQRVGGDIDDDFIRDIVGGCLRDNSSYIEKLNDAVKECNPEVVHNLAHKIKGSAGNISAKHLSAAASQLELASEAGDLENAEAMFAEIHNEFEKVKSFISQPNWIQTGKV